MPDPNAKDASPPSQPARGAHPALWAGLALVALAATWLDLRLRTDALRRSVEEWRQEQTSHLDQLENEMTRFRIEQRAEGKGVAALLEKLDWYAPLLNEARLPEPDYQWARKEMDAVLRAFRSLGEEAYPAVLEAFLAIPPGEQYDKRKWLLEAALAADPVRGKDLVRKVLRGYEPDVPVGRRLRWYAADVMLRIDKPLAGHLLREILRSESSRGPRQGDAGLPSDIRSSTGFDNFIFRYLQSEDPETENTLVMILGRPEHDLATLQECVKALGDLRSRKAVSFIQKLYRNPPVIRDNPIFQNHCLDALGKILGSEACSFFQEEMRKARHELVLRKLRALVQEFGC